MIWIVYGGLAIGLIFGFGVLFGAPYLPILRRDRDQVLDELQLTPGQTLLDLGSGDGTMLLAAARRGGQAIGIEINPFWWAVSYLRTRAYRQQVRVYYGNFWTLDWPAADYIYCFLITRYSGKMKPACVAKVAHPTVIISYGFRLPGLSLVRQVGAAYYYRYHPDS